MKPKPPNIKANGAAPPCIWMQAGVVRRKYCRTDYQCAACRYDAVLHRLAEENRERGKQVASPAGKKSKIVSWKDKLQERPPWKRPCLHHMKGRIEYRTCTNEYHCSDCEFDQFFFDQFSVHAAVQPIDLIDIEGFKIPQGFYLHRGHTWAKIEEENTVRVGLDEFVLRTIGPVDRIDAPLIGKTVRQNAPDIALRRGIKYRKSPFADQRCDHGHQPEVAGPWTRQQPRGLLGRLDHENSRRQSSPGIERSDDQCRNGRVYRKRNPAPLSGDRRDGRSFSRRRRATGRRHLRTTAAARLDEYRAPVFAIMTRQ